MEKINQYFANAVLRTSRILPEQHREWNENVQFNSIDLELFDERENKAKQTILEAPKCIANASNSSWIRSSNYLPSNIDVELLLALFSVSEDLNILVVLFREKFICYIKQNFPCVNTSKKYVWKYIWTS